jgi:alpha,alpha-trehalose phosphorylase
MQKERWNFEGTPAENYPLLLHYHPLVIYRHQVLKQPDVVLANFLQGHRFSRIQKIRDYEFYNPLTTGDSSLAPCIQSILSSELGMIDDAYDYFMKTARMDLDDINSNVADGVHIAAMGGTWLSLVYGFAGFRDYGGNLSFCPRLPAAWNGLSFKLRIEEMILSVDIDHERAVYSLAEPGCSGDASLNIRHKGTCYTIGCGAPVEVSMKRELQAVIFDLDGVITDTSEYHYLAWKMLADERGYTFTREINEKLRGIGRLESLDIILEASGMKLTAEDRRAQGEQKNEYYKELLNSITPESLLPGIASFIDDLKAGGVKIALASASRNAPEVIDRLGIEESFDIIMDAAKVEKGKPDPEIFVAAADALNVEPEHCVGVEDAEAGVDAIRAAGIFSVGIGRAADCADWAIDSTSDLNLEVLLEQFGD